MKRILAMIACVFFITSIVACSDDADAKNKEADMKVMAYMADILKTWEMKTVADVPSFTHSSGLAPSCSNCPGTNPDFAFFVKRGDPAKLMVFFMGGGACWDITNCVYNPTYSQDLFESIALLGMVSKGMGKSQGVGGFLDLTNPENPFRDWTIVYVPYCTGDLGAGQENHEYVDTYSPEPIANVTIRHRGAVNLALVVQWMQENIEDSTLTNLFVTGLSAGSYTALLSYHDIRQAFPVGDACLLGDAGVGNAADNYLGETFTEIAADRWNVVLPAAVFGTTDISTFANYELLFSEVVDYYSPDDRFSQYTTMYDATQTWFYNIQKGDNINFPNFWGSESGADPDLWVYEEWSNGMLNAIDVGSSPTNYRYYIGAGTDHTIIFYNKTYTEASVSDGTTFLDWVRSQIDNTGGWTNKTCSDCGAPF